MKKYFTVLFCLFIMLFASTANAKEFTSISKLQQYIENNAPAALSSPISNIVELEGTIADIRWYGVNNHFEMILLVDDDRGYTALEYDKPALIVHFRVHRPVIEFNVGDTIAVRGYLNNLYSSVIFPYILADTINGSDEY